MGATSFNVGAARAGHAWTAGVELGSVRLKRARKSDVISKENCQKACQPHPSLNTDCVAVA